MAPPAGTLRVGRYFLALLALFVVLFGIVFWPGQRHTPKLGLDLEGGTQVTFQAKEPAGKTPSKSSMLEARSIIEQRVNGYGVSNAEVVVQGSNQIVVSIPKSAANIASLGQAAVLNFRPVIMPPVTLAAVSAAEAAANATPTPSAGTSPSASTTATTSAGATTSGSGAAKSSSPATGSTAPTSGASGQDFRDQPLAATATTPATSPNPGASDTIPFTPNPTDVGTLPAVPSSASSAASTPMNYCVKPPKADTGTLPTCENPLASLGFAVPTTGAAFDALTSDQQTQLQAAISQFKCSSKPTDDTKATTLLACDSAVDASATTGFLLGPIIVPGSQISSASAVAPGSTPGQVAWQVTLNLKSTGSTNWAKWTKANNIGSTDTTTADVTTCGSTGTPCADFVAFTLDGSVLETPVTEGTIPAGTSTSISGNFSATQAKLLAQQLNYGALPLSFNAPSQTTVSAELGSGQLTDGLLAGGIGLILVVIYSLIYYRALGIVTIASLLVSGGLTYASLVILGHEIGFTLTLAGIAGFIVAVGITADSFVVFFERIKDEVHEGRSMRVAVPRAWIRARRTILSADTVSFLAAATLYYFAAGDVRGFAFTLGLSTILDLVVVFLFTHPMLSLLSRSTAFGSARFSGLDAVREGGVAVAAETGTWRPRARPAQRAATRNANRQQAKPGAASVAVLDETDADDETSDVIGDDGTDLLGSVTEVAPGAPTDAGAGAGAGADDQSAEGAPPGDGATAPTTAAERAAARRARMRAKSDESRS